MKKSHVNLLAAITLAFAAFTLGFFLGKNYNHSAVQVSVPQITASPTEAASVPSEEAAAETAVTFPVNINTATQTELMALPGIGEVIAQRIVDYREANGDFQSPEELLNVEGIGSGRLEAVWDLVTVGG